MKTEGDYITAICEHIRATGHRCSLDDVKVLGQEDKTIQRKIREAMQIHKRRPALNRDRGLEIPPVMLQLLSRDPPVM